MEQSLRTLPGDIDAPPEASPWKFRPLLLHMLREIMWINGAHVKLVKDKARPRPATDSVRTGSMAGEAPFYSTRQFGAKVEHKALAVAEALYPMLL